VVFAIRRAASDEPLSLHEIARGLPDSRVRDNLLAVASYSECSVGELAAMIGSSGFSAETMPLALAIVPHILANGLDMTLRALNEVGGDTDTIASIAGQVAGARMGFAALPIHLLADVPRTNEVLTIAENFAALGAN
jgi:ADP-ribosylglycohydrolase